MYIHMKCDETLIGTTMGPGGQHGTLHNSAEKYIKFPIEAQQDIEEFYTRLNNI